LNSLQVRKMRYLLLLSLLLVGTYSLHEKCKIIDETLVCTGILESENNETGHETIKSAVYQNSSIAITEPFIARHPNTESFSFFGVESIDVDAFKNSPKLQQIFIQDLNGSLPNRILENTNVTSFDITHCQFHNISQPFLISDSLKYLRMLENEISYIGSNTFSGLPNLLEIHMQHNKLEELPEGLFVNNNKLNNINFLNNNLSKVPDSLFKNLENDFLLTLHKNNFDCDEEDTKKLIRVLREKKAEVVGGCTKPRDLSFDDIQV